ncbi:MAG: protein translocase subunit SecF [Peptococcaceae bacterium]|nr:protein translocase subunit SecF [Peptococcaceae bacterium]
MTDKKLGGYSSENKPPKNIIPAEGGVTYEQVKKQYRFYFNVVNKRYIWFALSLLILIPGIISLMVQGLNLGIDYKGGSMFNIRFEQSITQMQITNALDSVGLSGQVQLSNNGNEVLVRTDALSDEQRDAFLKAIEKEVGSFDRANLEESLVGPAIGAELKSSAIKATTVAAILILLYITVRFKFIYAFSGTLTLIHDVLIILGLFSIFQWEIDANFIAAVLTIFGYSINDTVVILDRIRENEKKMKKRDSYEDMVDKSIWQTMGRSLKTGGTVIIALLAILILGGESTKIFALAMLIGVFAGAYSSIFIASQLVVEYKARFGGRVGSKKS